MTEKAFENIMCLEFIINSFNEEFAQYDINDEFVMRYTIFGDETNVTSVYIHCDEIEDESEITEGKGVTIDINAIETMDNDAFYLAVTNYINDYLDDNLFYTSDKYIDFE